MSNYGTFMDKFIENYKEMLVLIVQARIASDRVDEWQKALESVLNPEPRSRIDELELTANKTFKFIDYDKYI